MSSWTGKASRRIRERNQLRFSLRGRSASGGPALGEAPDGADNDERIDMANAIEALHAHGLELCNTITAHRRVSSRLGGTKKPTQLDISLAILKEFVTLNDTLTKLTVDWPITRRSWGRT